jgi:hypothetical protein
VFDLLSGVKAASPPADSIVGDSMALDLEFIDVEVVGVEYREVVDLEFFLYFKIPITNAMINVTPTTMKTTVVSLLVQIQLFSLGSLVDATL